MTAFMSGKNYNSLKGWDLKMSQNVKFFFTSTKAKYDALQEKNPLALYFVTDAATDCNYLYKGDELIAAGHMASSEHSGLMSAEDKALLKSIPDVYARVDEVVSIEEVDKLKTYVDEQIQIVESGNIDDGEI